MESIAIRQQKAALRRETAAWQWAAVGLLVLSVLANTALWARIERLESQRQETAVQLEQAEYARDLAVQELGATAMEQAREKEARAAQAAAYEALGAWEYVGECTVTYYCPCEACCGRWADGLTATGLPAGPGIVAVDPGIIPLGSTVVIDGQKYLAADTGVQGRHVDVCVASHQETVELGVRTAEVWVEAAK